MNFILSADSYFRAITFNFDAKLKGCFESSEQFLKTKHSRNKKCETTFTNRAILS